MAKCKSQGSTIVLIDHNSRVQSINVTKHDTRKNTIQRNVLETEGLASNLMTKRFSLALGKKIDHLE